MSGTKNRNIKILGAGWLALGGIFLAIAPFAIGQFIIDPSAAEAEEGLVGGLGFVLVLVVVGSTPDFRTISDFRKDNVDALSGLFRTGTGVVPAGGAGEAGARGAGRHEGQGQRIEA